MTTTKITLDQFTKYDKKTHAETQVSYTFSTVPTATYKWGVFGSNSARAFKADAWARSQEQAHQYARRHGLGLFGYVVGKLTGGEASK